MGETLWVEPARITHKIAPSRGLSGTRGGEWDIERRQPVTETAKFKSIAARFVEGVPWIETELFADLYCRRLARDGRIGRFRSLEDLARDYERRFGALFEAMKLEGFRTQNDNGKPYALPALLVGRGGEIFIGNQGNHRLAIAMVLGLDRFAGRITCRHSQACLPSPQ